VRRKRNIPDWKAQELAATQSELAAMVKHAYTAVYVACMVRAHKEDCTFLDAVRRELDERGALERAEDFLEFELLRLGLLEIERSEQEVTP
jgi:hypothetical protein